MSDRRRARRQQKRLAQATLRDSAEAKARAGRYSKIAGFSGRVLSVGCGVGFFVKECSSLGMDAYGCDQPFPNQQPRVYRRRLEDIHFPTDHFDAVCLHLAAYRVTEDCRLLFFSELLRITAQNGILVIDVLPHDNPYYFIKLLERMGFSVVQKIDMEKDCWTFVVKKPKQNRTSILLPPGVGDAYWSLIKLQSLLKIKEISAPVDASVAAPKAKRFNSHLRATPFLAMYPFLHATGDCVFNRRDPVWNEAYKKQARSVFDDVLGHDLFLSWNGYLRAGRKLEDVDPEYRVRWQLPRFISLREEEYRKWCRTTFGRYVLFYYVLTGTNGMLLHHWTIEDITNSIKQIVKGTGLTPILIGANWDSGEAAITPILRSIPEMKDWRGKTSIEEVFGMIRGADLVVGMNSGITIMSAVFGVKTVLLYHKYLFTNGVDRSFAWNTFPPETHGVNYFPEFADKIGPDGFASRAISVFHGQEIEPKPEARTVISRKHPIKETPSAVTSIRDLDEPAKQPEPTPQKKPVVVCVYRTGGDFFPNYVHRLVSAVRRNSLLELDILCLTDDPALSGDFKTVPLKDTWPGWWSKVEMFRSDIFDHRRAVYFDLDTVLLGNIDPLFEMEEWFGALRPWNARNRANGIFASGVLSWDPARYGWLYNEFQNEHMRQFRGDQEYFSSQLNQRQYPWKPLQEVIPICSFKRQCRQGVPADARIVCFHGKPRLPEVESLPWVKENWK